MPGHSEVKGNEQADLYAKAAAETGAWEKADREKETVSLATLNARRTSKATKEWIRDIEDRNRDKSFQKSHARLEASDPKGPRTYLEKYCGKVLSVGQRIRDDHPHFKGKVSVDRL